MAAPTPSLLPTLFSPTLWRCLQQCRDGVDVVLEVVNCGNASHPNCRCLEAIIGLSFNETEPGKSLIALSSAAPMPF